MTWRRLCVLLSNLSGDAVYRAVTKSKPTPYTAKNASEFFASFPKAGDK